MYQVEQSEIEIDRREEGNQRQQELWPAERDVKIVRVAPIKARDARLPDGVIADQQRPTFTTFRDAHGDRFFYSPAAAGCGAAVDPRCDQVSRYPNPTATKI